MQREATWAPEALGSEHDCEIAAPQALNLQPQTRFNSKIIASVKVNNEVRRVNFSPLDNVQIVTSGEARTHVN